MKKKLSKSEFAILRFIRNYIYLRNEPFDLIKAFVCLICKLLKKKIVVKMNIDENIQKYASQETLHNIRLYKKLYNDVLYSTLVFGSMAQEYFAFDFYSKTYEERRKYITMYSRAQEFDEKINVKKATAVFYNKYKTYNAFKKYYGRKLIRIAPDIDNYNEFYDFVVSMDKFVYKPTTLGSGKGIKLIQNYTPESLPALYDSFKADGECVIEEVIVQAPEMAAINPSSVNTMRMLTVITTDGIRIVNPFLRMGRNNSFVDNAGSGGVFALVDEESGIVCATPIDEDKNSYIFHPDSNMQLVGFKIPRWEEAKTLARELAKEVPEVRFVGWDLALTKDGWIMIEGNANAILIPQQMLIHKGMKKDLYSLI
jgi:hypothetical protein